MPSLSSSIMMNILIISAAAAIPAATGRARSSSSSFIYADCSPCRIPGSSAVFQSNLKSLLGSMARSASSNSAYNSFTSSSSPPDPSGALYGLYQCRSDLSGRECWDCVGSAGSQVGLACPDACGAALQLDGCIVRYSPDDFLGRPDESVAYKKCSKEEAVDGDFERRRDDVLGDLGRSAGDRDERGFRVSGSGTVQGYAQCEGDLNPPDCRACLAQAADQLRSLCPASLASDLFLRKCYARFWASGYYPRSADYTDDDVGKTVAIIVGVLAGLAFLVVFLSFLKKAC